MTSSMKIILPLLSLGIVLLLTATHYSSSSPEYTDNIEGLIDPHRQVSRYSRAVKPIVQYCRLNHFYDEEKGRCLSVPGGGRILHVEKGRSCGINILKSHCTSSLYYHICTRDRSILAQCGSGQIFDSRRQRCFTSRQTQPDDHEHYDQNSVPDCAKPGRFSVPNHCSVFYTCNTNGRQLYRSVYKCPRNTGYYADRGTCAAMPGCENDDSVDYAVCVPGSPDENLESQNSDKEDAAEGDVEETAETSKEHDTTNVNDEVVEAIEEFEEKRNASPKIDDYPASATPDSATDNLQPVDNKEANDDDIDNTSTQPIEEPKLEEKRNIDPEIDGYPVSTTPDSVMDNPRVDNEEKNDDNIDNISTQPIRKPELEEKKNASPEIDDYPVSTTPGSAMDNLQPVDNKEASHARLRKRRFGRLRSLRSRLAGREPRVSEF
ncbi:hypothetical protein X777_06735 [Ooceraea biroi]|uniref:Chitin-binding type-2 domain-containing protein n=1 Tax=Ooceraea biroi TaxID=2015173 RepID=A0A026X3T4_OOCBI|nr:hypothetical protein X777_06735 [Ooceraea biroi]